MALAPAFKNLRATAHSWTASERLIGFVLALSILLSDFSRFLAGPAQLAFFDDDFFYYLQVARNLALGHGSTFDGIHRTNGYHPLWLAVLWLVCLLPQAAWLPIVTCMAAAGAWICFLLARRIFLLQSCHPAVACCAAAAFSFAAMFLNRGGMEIILTLPLIFLLVYLRLAGSVSLRGNAAIVYGLLGALIVLSRLDAILFVALLFIAELARLAAHRRAELIAALGRLLLGLLPIAIYLLLNLSYFGTLLTVSSQAKQLEPHPAFSFGLTVYLFHFLPGGLRVVALVPAYVAALLVAARLTRRRRAPLPQRDLPIVLSLIVFPVLHMLALASLSDWPLWLWYLYSWILGLLGALILLLRAAPERANTGPPGWHGALRMAAVSSLLVFLAGYTTQRVRLALHPAGVTFSIYDTSVPLASFARDHPGIYAMGDRAGLSAFVLGRPLLQLEGLVMDQAYLEHIRREEDLTHVLNAYGVRYYIGTNLVRQGACFLAVEPTQAGPRSPKLRTTLCRQPIAVWHTADAETTLFDLTSTR